VTDTVKTRLEALETTQLPSAITATAIEINAKCDRSAQVVALAATTAITQALHEGRVLIVTGTAAAAYTLPEATGSGDRYKFIMNQVNTNGTTFVAADTTNTSYHGSINLLDVDAASQTAYFTVTAGGTDTVTFNGTTTGGQIGDILEFVDIGTDRWSVFGQARVPAGSNPATPFSSAA
jgi:hypothetical protein